MPFYSDLPPPSKSTDPAQAISETLGQIPPTDKTDYRDSPERFLSRRADPRVLHKSQTSGTTGTAIPLWQTSQSIAEEYACVWRLRRMLGVEFQDPYFTFNGQTIVPYRDERGPFFRRNLYAGQSLFSIYHLRPENFPGYIEALHSLPATYAEGYPSALSVVARALLDAGEPLPKGKLKGVFTSSENLLSFQKDVIEEAFGTSVRDRYGVSEFSASMTECEEGRLHVDMEFCIVEVETDDETDDYVRGPLLVTGFANDAVPLVRYRIGDVGTRAKRPCPCGREGDVFNSIDGRSEDYVVTGDGRLVGRLDHVFKHQYEVREAQIVQESRALIRVLVVPSERFSEGHQAELERELRTRIGPDLLITIDRVSHIPREPNGKFRAVRSLVSEAAVKSRTAT